jgi:hypothetical protein
MMGYRRANLAGVAKYGLAVALHVFIESNAWPSLGQDQVKRGLAAQLGDPHQG